MKKRNITLSIIIFILLKILYFVSIKHWMEIKPNTDFFIYAPLFCLLCMTYFSINLWKNTTNEFIDSLSDNTVSHYNNIFTTVVLIFTAFKHYKDYHVLPIFESNIVLFIGVGAIDAIAILLFFNMLFRSFSLTMYRAKNNE